MRTHSIRLREALALLLVGSAALFAIGSTIERHQHHTETAAAAKPAASSDSGHSDASGANSGSGEGATTNVENSGGESGHSEESGAKSSSGEGATSHAEESSGESGVKLLGVDTESLALTVVAVAVSLLLALAVWLQRWRRLTLLCVAGFGLVFAAGDARELVHQLNESNAGLATIAAVLIGMHLTVTALAAALYPRHGKASSLAVAEPHA